MRVRPASGPNAGFPLSIPAAAGVPLVTARVVDGLAVVLVVLGAVQVELLVPGGAALFQDPAELAAVAELRDLVVAFDSRLCPGSLPALLARDALERKGRYESFHASATRN